MIGRILVLILIFFLNIQMAFSQEMFKITSVNLDTSNSIVLLTSKFSAVSEDIKDIKINELENPKRYYFDLKSSVLNAGAQNWFFNSNDIKQIKISQFNPETVRVVLYTTDNFDKSKIMILKQNKSLIIKFKDEICEKDYFNPVYTDEKISSSKFYENLSITSSEIDKLKTVQSEINKEDALSQVQDAFSVNKTESEKIIKDLKLQANYYISSIVAKPDAVLLSGFGNITLEKPMYLKNPTRIVYDIPNSITNYDIRNKQLTSSGTLMKIAQFDSSRSRLVITPPTEDVDYTPVFSPDGQYVLFIKQGYSGKLYNQKNNANGYYLNNKKELIVSFDAPVVHSVKKDAENLCIVLYNTYSFNEEAFNRTISKSVFQNAKVTLLPKTGLKLDIPITKNAVVKTYMGADGKAIKIILNNMSVVTPQKEQQVTPKKEKKEKLQKIKGKKVVIIDAGHGGHDYGAIRDGINEKDINLDVAQSVSDILTKHGVTVVMTRDSDEFIALADRVEISQNNNADLFLSVHVNASVKPEIVGIETHYYNDNSLEFANTVHESMINNIKRTDRGIFKSKFYVIKNNTMPAILVEIGFISNDEERKDLLTAERKSKTAQGIAEGILKYLNSN